MLDFVGLPWDERCLEFHRTRPRRLDRQQMAGATPHAQILGRALATLPPFRGAVDGPERTREALKETAEFLRIKAP